MLLLNLQVLLDEAMLAIRSSQTALFPGFGRYVEHDFYSGIIPTF